MKFEEISSTDLLLAIKNLLPEQVIELGDGKFCSRHAGVRIRRMPTAGGIKIGIHQVNSLGQQGSGAYFDLSEDALEYAILRKADYLKPLPRFLATKEILETRGKIKWHLFTAEDESEFVQINPTMQEYLVSSTPKIHF